MSRKVVIPVVGGVAPESAGHAEWRRQMANEASRLMAVEEAAILGTAQGNCARCGCVVDLSTAPIRACAGVTFTGNPNRPFCASCNANEDAIHAAFRGGRP